jgi:excisionase family DNA binding protein
LGKDRNRYGKGDCVSGESIELLKVREAATALRLSLPETYARIRDGRLPSVSIGPRGTRVPRRVIDEMIVRALQKDGR